MVICLYSIVNWMTQIIKFSCEGFRKESLPEGKAKRRKREEISNNWFQLNKSGKKSLLLEVFVCSSLQSRRFQFIDCAHATEGFRGERSALHSRSVLANIVIINRTTAASENPQKRLDFGTAKIIRLYYGQNIVVLYVSPASKPVGEVFRYSNVSRADTCFNHSFLLSPLRVLIVCLVCAHFERHPLDIRLMLESGVAHGKNLRCSIPDRAFGSEAVSDL